MLLHPLSSRESRSRDADRHPLDDARRARWLVGPDAPGSSAGVVVEENLSNGSVSSVYAPTSEANTRTNTSQMPIAAHRLSLMEEPASDRWR